MANEPDNEAVDDLTKPPFLRRVRIRGYKSIAFCDVTLEPLTILVGRNASVFAGRIADTGRDPVPLMAEAVRQVRQTSNVQLIWASPRELLNIFQADAIGCHIITATEDILKKLSLVGKDLDEYSLDTVKMFHSDAVGAGFELKTESLVTVPHR